MEKDSQNHFRELIAYDPTLGLPPTEAIAAALEASLRDPNLRAQDEAEKAFDGAWREKLREIPVPEGLQARILEAHARQPREAGAGIAESAPPHTRGWWTHVALLGSMAAAILVLTLVYTFLINPFNARETPELTAMVASIESSLHHHGGMYFSEDYSELVSYLSASSAPVPEALPAGIGPESSFACREMTIDGKRVAMLCFKRENATFHLFTLSRDALPELANILRPVITEFDKNRCATWTDEHNIYVLATSAPRQVLLSAL